MVEIIMSNHTPAKVIARLAMTGEGQKILDKVMNELDKEAKEALPKIALRNDTHDKLDDVVVENVEMFRAEMMSDQSLWIACYLLNGEQIAFHVCVGGKNSRAPLDFSCTDYPAYVDWDSGEIKNYRE
jgi:hypothetical protein